MRIGKTACGVLAALLLAVGGGEARAQSWAADGPIVHGHHHLNVTDRAAHERFWGDTLGGVAVPLGDTHIFKFPHALVFLTDQAPTGGTIGSALNHIGMWVPNTRAMLDRVVAAGFEVITEQELPHREVDDGMVCTESANTCIAYVLAPDDVKVEIVENRGQTEPIRNHHLHFHTTDVDGMRDWYARMFGAVPGMNYQFKVVDLPGVNIRFSDYGGQPVPIRGRSYDHIGFEVDGLEALCRRLEAEGVTFDRPYTVLEGMDVAFAFLTDPWGITIELTEGLDQF